MKTITLKFSIFFGLLVGASVALSAPAVPADGTNPVSLTVTSESGDVVVGFAAIEDDNINGVGEDQTQRQNVTQSENVGG